MTDRDTIKRIFIEADTDTAKSYLELASVILEIREITERDDPPAEEAPKPRRGRKPGSRNIMQTPISVQVSALTPPVDAPHSEHVPAGMLGCSPDRNLWPKRCEEAFLAKLGQDTFNQCLVDVIGIANIHQVYTGNYKAIWARMTKAADALVADAAPREQLTLT